MSDNNEADSRSEAELRSFIEKTRAEMVTTLEVLSHEMQPKVQVGYAADALKDRAEEVKVTIQGTIAEAEQGDREALRKIAATMGITAGISAVVIILITRRIKRRRG